MYSKNYYIILLIDKYSEEESMFRFTTLIILVIFMFCPIVLQDSYAGQSFPIPDSDNDSENFGLSAFFDLRERESFIQITNNEGTTATLHVQIFNVGQNCNENNFFDTYTINDTHVYNMREILTNDGNPSGVVLPEDAYGIVVVTSVDPEDFGFEEIALFGNFRILDSNGYEYRSNMTGYNDDSEFPDILENDLTFNFNQLSGVTLSDVVGIYLVDFQEGQVDEWRADNITRTFLVVDVDIYDLNEVPFSCRDVAFACVQPDSPFVEDILAYTGGGDATFDGTNGATAASFEYGINESIPHSKNGELLCPGNVITDGFVSMNTQGSAYPDNFGGDYIINIFVGLNNGNGRGSMDAVWFPNGLNELVD